MTKKTNKTRIRDIIDHIRALPHWYIAVFGIVFTALIIAVIFWPMSTTFSYAQKNCFYQPTLFPSLLKSHSDVFRLEPSRRISIGNVSLAALDMCMTPLKAPKSGVYDVGLSSQWVPFVQKLYSISVPELPKASIEFLNKKPLPVGHSLRISLSRPDSVYKYMVRFSDDKTAGCESEGFDIVCDITGLDLNQGEEYTLSLERYFNNIKVDTVSRQLIVTLRALEVVESSINRGDVVYSKPNSVTIITDKELESASATLETLGDKGTSIPIEVSTNGNKILVSWKKDLARREKFRLTLVDAVAVDGSSLDGFYKISFSTSGGPRVASINIGSYKVPLGSTAVIKFDQPLLKSQNIENFVTATGGATVTGKNGSDVYVSLANVSRCSDVRITVNKGLISKYGVSGGSAWTFDTRTICQKITTIGTSLNGRPINAYWFGNGAKTTVYTAAIHGNEASTYYLMQSWINNLEANIRRLPSNRQVIVVPLLNPDGFYAGTRTNARNVDLNRNFGTSDWKKNITDVYNNPFPGGGGSSPFSEPETRAIANLVESVGPTLVVSYHSTGSLVLANHIGNSSEMASVYSSSSGYSYSHSTGDSFDYSVSGTADDYYGQNLGVPSILVELGSDTYSEFGQNSAALWKILEG